MVKGTTLLLLCAVVLHANAFEKNCLVCHEKDFKFSIMMKRYTLRHSSEAEIKKAIFKYLKKPTRKDSVLPSGYLNQFGIKEKSDLNDVVLRDMIDIYYQEYNIKSKIY